MCSARSKVNEDDAGLVQEAHVAQLLTDGLVAGGGDPGGVAWEDLPLRAGGVIYDIARLGEVVHRSLVDAEAGIRLVFGSSPPVPGHVVGWGRFVELNRIERGEGNWRPGPTRGRWSTGEGGITLGAREALSGNP